jgi:hypothetical protein
MKTFAALKEEFLFRLLLAYTFLCNIANRYFGSSPLVQRVAIPRYGAMDLIWGVIAVVAVVIIVGVGLIILFDVQNVASTTGSLNSAQSAQLSSTFNSMVSSYGLLPIVVIVMAAGLVIGAFFIFVRPGGGEAAPV